MFFWFWKRAAGKIRRAQLGSACGRAEAWRRAESVTAVVIGAQTEALAAEAAAKGVGKVMRVEHPLLAQLHGRMVLRRACNNSSKTRSPTYVVFPHTYQVRDYAPALAARMGQVLIGDVIAIEDGPIFTRQLMQGRLNGNLSAQRQRAVLCLRAGGSVSRRCCLTPRGTGPAPIENIRRRRSMPRRFAPSPASRSATRRRRSTWARRNAS